MFLHIPNFLQSLGHERYMLVLGVFIPCWALFMTLLERLFPYTKNIKLFRRGFWIDLVWYTFVQSKVLEIIIFQYIILNLKSSLGLEKFGPLSELNFWVLLAFFFFTHDFYIYWFHRLQHNNKYLWRTHEAHHSVRTVDWLAGSRSHPLEILINQTIEFAPIFFLLDSQTALFMYPAKAFLDAIWGMWIHANVNINSGKLQYIINGPEMHQWHHANHHEVFYKNYSTKLAIWDWMFGTAFLPSLKPLRFDFLKPQMFGLPYAYPQGYFAQLLYALIRFDFKYLESKSIYADILQLRKKITIQFSGVLGLSRNWVETMIFDSNSDQYKSDDIEQKICPSCGELKKYFYTKNSFVTVCEYCSKDTELSKFN